ncbi:MAG TPA: glycosyltransferase family 4 protein, partial [Acidimicrobiales bacterium]|nr:glycosyltransferase family 4 protein [Acidimicrobiales bacterium]
DPGDAGDDPGDAGDDPGDAGDDPGDAVKVAVYDRYWPTGGGGEKFAAGIAAALAPEHDVRLLAHEPLDLGWLGERLDLDLSAVAVDVVDDDLGVAAASEAYDLFVNASYLSWDANRARHGLFVVHFPGPRPDRAEEARRWLAGRARPVLAAGGVTVELGDRWYTPESTRLHGIRWTGGHADLVVRSAAGGRVPVMVLLGRYLPPQVAPVEVVAEVDGTPVGRAVVDVPASRLDRRRTVALSFAVDAPPGVPVRVDLRCPSWVPAEAGVGTDRRPLGVPVVGALAGGGWRARLARAAPVLAGPTGRPTYLDSYDRVLANSRYTQGWIARLWGRDSDVLHPPVTLVERREKAPLILSVGRFFMPGTGHNKKQLEMVEAFRRLVASGGAEGWEYHLAGGCAPEHRPYLDQIEEAAAGLPVVLHPDAGGAELRELYGRASIFWHAAGLGEDPERHPDRFEHFGITTVEAMSAGAVPVVIDAAGQVEIVEQGVSGYRFAGLDGLVDNTRLLVADPAWRATLAEAAERRARRFGWDAFVTHLRAEVAALDAGRAQ